jgi:hypothetical protein
VVNADLISTTIVQFQLLSFHVCVLLLLNIGVQMANANANAIINDRLTTLNANVRSIIIIRHRKKQRDK